MLARKIPAGEFKAQCLQIMDKVKKTHKKVIITKRNVPIAQLVPMDDEDTVVFGRLKGTVRILGNIIDPINEAWNADS